MNFENFQNAMIACAKNIENICADGSVNWDYVDADMYMDGWSKNLGNESYTIWFDEVASSIEPK